MGQKFVLRRNHVSMNATYGHFPRKRHSFYGYLLLIPLPHGRIAKDGNCEEFSSVTEIRGGSRMEKRLSGGRGGGGEEEKRRPGHGTKRLRRRENCRKSEKRRAVCQIGRRSCRAGSMFWNEQVRTPRGNILDPSRYLDSDITAHPKK